MRHTWRWQCQDNPEDCHYLDAGLSVHEVRMRTECCLGMIGNGAYRDVYALPDDKHVLKMQNWQSAHGTTQLSQWHEVVRGSSDPDLPLARVVASDRGPGYVWLVQERVSRVLGWAQDDCGHESHYAGNGQTIECSLYDEFDEICERLYAELKAKGLEINDFHAWNVGQRIDGTWVFIDYGM